MNPLSPNNTKTKLLLRTATLTLLWSVLAIISLSWVNPQINSFKIHFWGNFDQNSRWQVFWSENAGFSASDSIYLDDRLIKNQRLTHILDRGSNLVFLRIDPDDLNYEIQKLSSVVITNGISYPKIQLSVQDCLVASNNIQMDESTGEFRTIAADPQLVFGISKALRSLQLEIKNKKKFIQLFAVILMLPLAMLIHAVGHIFAKKSKHYLFSIYSILIGALIFATYAIINGFPLTFLDSGTYLYCGLDWRVPSDRPVSYAIFTNIAALGNNLWFVVFTQCLLLSILIYGLVRKVFGNISEEFWNLNLCIYTILGCFTSLSWFSSMLQPDIFIAMTPITTLLLITKPYPNRLQSALLLVVYIFTTIAHTSNILNSIAISLLLIAFWFILKPAYSLKRTLILVFLAFASIPILSSIGWIISGEWGQSKDSPIFLGAKLVNHGLLQDYLENSPEGENYELYQHRKEIKPRSGHFLWNQSSPLYQMDRKKIRKELKSINFKILTDPEYFSKFVYHGTIDTWEVVQGKRLKSTIFPNKGRYAINRCIKERFPNQLRAFENAKQHDWSLYNYLFQKTNRTLLIVSYFTIIVSVIFLNRNYRSIKFYAVFFLTYIILNDWISAMLSAPMCRLHLRVSWLCVLALLLLLGTICHRRLYRSPQTTKQD